jgi:hypothetical protein
MGKVVSCICPNCNTVQSFPDQYAGTIEAGVIRDCIRCGKVFVVPRVSSSGQEDESKGAPLRGRLPTQEEREAYVDAKAGLDKSPSWFAGVVIPLLLIIHAIWCGFILQDIYMPGGSRPGSPGLWLTGQAAVWGGLSTICGAAVLHAWLFWARIARFRTAAIWSALAGIVGFLVAALMAALAG